MEIFAFTLFLSSLIGLAKWFMAEFKIRSLRAELRELYQLLEDHPPKCSQLLTTEELYEIFGECRK